MKNIVKFNCIEISEHPISYEINSLFGFFKVIGNRGESLASKENLEDAVNFLLRSIRYSRAIRYFDSESNIDGRVEDYLVKGKNELPGIYKRYVDRLCREIRAGKNNYIVYGRNGDQFLIDNVIYFDKLFLQEIDELNEKLKFEF